jgi:hypothetical protein
MPAESSDILQGFTELFNYAYNAHRQFNLARLESGAKMISRKLLQAISERTLALVLERRGGLWKLPSSYRLFFSFRCLP